MDLDKSDKTDTESRPCRSTVWAQVVTSPHQQSCSSLPIYLNLIPPSQLWFHRSPLSWKGLDHIPCSARVRDWHSSFPASFQAVTDTAHPLQVKLLIASSLLGFCLPGPYLDSTFCNVSALQRPHLSPASSIFSPHHHFSNSLTPVRPTWVLHFLLI